MNLSPTSLTAAGKFAWARYHWLALGLVVIAAIALRLQGLDRTLTVDEAWTVAAATAPDFWATARKDVHPPLYYYLVRLVWMSADSFTALRLFSVGCGLGLLALVLVAFRKNPVAALVAGAAVAGLPGFVLFSQQLRSYSLLLLLLAVALVLAVRIFQGATDLRARILLSVVLALAAATHLITVFFLLALAPLLFWPARAGPARGWFAALLPLGPPGLLALGLKFYFITPPETLGGGWWMTVDTTTVLRALGEAVGWNEMPWLADAWSRHAPGNGWPVLAGALAAVLIALGTAWSRRPSHPLVWPLLFSAIIYTIGVISYSCLFEHVIMMRTLLPGLLPFLASLALGIGSHPVSWRRSVAAAAVFSYVAMAATPVSRRATVPDAGLRGLVAATNAVCRPGDLLLVFRAMDYSLAAYQCPPPGTEVLFFDQTVAAEPQLAGLKKRLGRLDHSRRVLVVYRDDYYLRQFRGVFDKALAEISRHGWKPGPGGWVELDLGLIVTGPAATAP